MKPALSLLSLMLAACGSPSPNTAGLASAPVDKPTATALADDFTCALFASGQVKCWGAPPLGYGDWTIRGMVPTDMGSNLPYLAFGSGVRFTQVVAGGAHACALTDDGRVKCWGENDDGSAGIGTVDASEAVAALPDVDLGTGVKATQLAAGTSHTCALLADQTMKCWGTNDHGQLGVPALAGKVVGNHAGDMGDQLPRSDLGPGATVKAIAAGNNNTCAELADGAWRCWGENEDGRLCLGDGLDRGLKAGDMGAATPVVDLGAGTSVKRLAVGDSYACALVREPGRDDDAVKCWGENGQGELGLMDAVQRCTATAAVAPKDLPEIDLGGLRAVDLSVAEHACALLENGAVKCWGANALGQLGLGDNAARGDLANSMGDELPFVDLGGGSDVGAVVAGGEHTCALLAPGSVKCWGSNAYGMLGLGLGNVRAVGTAPEDMGAGLPPVDL